MKKVALTLLLPLFFVPTLISQTHIFQFRKNRNDKWHYASFDGKLNIETGYKIYSEFTEDGRALIPAGRKFTIIDTQGKLIPIEIDNIRLIVDDFAIEARSSQKENETSYNVGIHGFSDGYLVVKVKNKWGCLSGDGQIAISIKYDRITDFKSGSSFAELGGKFYVLDKKGSEYLVDVSNIAGVRNFSEGMGLFQVKEGKWGFVDGKGIVVIKPQYKGVGYFRAGLAWARAENGDLGYINKDSEWVIEPAFNGAWNFDSISGMAKVKLRNHNRYVDTKGGIYDFEDINSRLLYDFSEGLAVAVKSDKYGYIDKTGEWVIPPHFSKARSFKNGYAAANSKNRWGIIDKEGNWVIQPTYFEIGNVSVVK